MLEVRILQDGIDIQARVSLEEVLVASLTSGRHGAVDAHALAAHGNYLLQHLSVLADDQKLAGQTQTVPNRPEGFLIYNLHFPVLGHRPTRLQLCEDILREFEFAPGNPWEASFMVRAAWDGADFTDVGILTAHAPLILEQDSGGNIETFVRHGLTHILTGYDHLLFVAALILAPMGFWQLFKVITAFTIAHSLTLALSVLDLFRLPSGIVEPVIAISIVVTAAQNIFWPGRSQGNSRLLIAFAFGLFHGLGFAGGLLDAIAVDTTMNIYLGIAAFSLGVELAHQIVIVPVYTGIRIMNAFGISIRPFASSAILLGGLFYVISTLNGFQFCY